jgi:adenylate cyclase
VERRLAAILAADVVGYSRLMAADEQGTHARLKALRQDLIEPKIAEHRGRIVKLMGDGTLVEFASVVDSVECAAEIQTGVAEHQAELAENQRIAFRIGINIGDIIIEDDDIYGSGVNIAARLEALAEPGGICVARNVYDQVKDKVAFGFAPMGEHCVKNIPEPVTVYRVSSDPDLSARTTRLQHARRPSWRWSVAAATAAIVLAAAGIAWWYRDRAAESQPDVAAAALPLPDKPSIAVLPFDNLGGDPAEESFGLGIAEDLITDLSKLRGLFVIARNSSFAFRGKSAEVQRIGRELGVRYLLDGSVRRASDQLRINAQLVDAGTGEPVWAERFDRPIRDVFAVQDEITRRIVETLEVELVEGEQARMWRRQATDPRAYELFLAGRSLVFEHSRDSMRRAIEVLEEAVRIDPHLAAAWVWLGWAYWGHVYSGWTDRPEKFEAQARNAAERAIAADPSFGAPHALLSDIAGYHDDSDTAVAEVERAVELSPGSADDLAFLSAWRTAARPDEALGLIERALRLNPIPPAWYHNVLGQAYLALRRFDDAVAAFGDCIERAPDFVTCRRFLTATYLEAGRFDDARREAKEVLRINPDYSIADEYWVKDTKDPAERERRAALLKQAGLPE